MTRRDHWHEDARAAMAVLLAELPPNQIALCAWFHNRE